MSSEKESSPLFIAISEKNPRSHSNPMELTQLLEALASYIPARKLAVQVLDSNGNLSYREIGSVKLEFIPLQSPSTRPSSSPRGVEYPALSRGGSAISEDDEVPPFVTPAITQGFVPTPTGYQDAGQREAHKLATTTPSEMNFIQSIPPAIERPVEPPSASNDASAPKTKVRLDDPKENDAVEPSLDEANLDPDDPDLLPDPTPASGRFEVLNVVKGTPGPEHSFFQRMLHKIT